MGKTAIIIPCYNEEFRLNLEKFQHFVSQNKDIHLWFVNDGSTDNTLDKLQALSQNNPDSIFVHSMQQNSGKAEAVRVAFMFVSDIHVYDYIGFIDADLSSPLADILLLQSKMNNTDLLLAAGVRIKILGNNIVRKPFRHYISRIFATTYNLILDIPNYDTQCGLKLFNSDIVRSVFDKPFVSKWLFDIEIFLRIQGAVGKENYVKKVCEIPVNEWKEVGGSKLKTSDFILAPLEILKIYRKYKKIVVS